MKKNFFHLREAADLSRLRSKLSKLARRMSAHPSAPLARKFRALAERFEQLARGAGLRLAAASLAVGALGLAPAAAQTFASSVPNPFGLDNVGVLATPTFADIDGDGDLDAFIGNLDGNINFFQNNRVGTSGVPVFATSVSNPFGLANVGTYASLSFADIDGDGDLDAFVGQVSGNIYFFQNNRVGTSGVPVFAIPVPNPFGLETVYFNASPSFADIDNDGDLDAFIGESFGYTRFFRNNRVGISGAPIFVLVPSDFPFGLANVVSFASPSFADLDGDGDLDAFIGNFDGNTIFFQNTGTTGVPNFAASSTNPFGLAGVGPGASPDFADIDGDGDLDAFIGDGPGNTFFFENITPVAAATTWNGTAWDNGVPTTGIDAILNAPYSGAGFVCDDLVLNANLTIGATQEFTVEGAISGTGSVNLLSASQGPGYYDYTIGSLIHTTDGIPGSVKRYLSGGANDVGLADVKWHFIQSPVGDFPVERYFRGDYVYRYAPGTDTWETLVLGDNFSEGQAYLVHSPNTETKTFSGNLNAGTFSFTAPASGQYAIVGNPYPSPIDWALVPLGPADEKAFLWNAINNTYDYNDQSAGTGSFATGMIPPTQGFAVYTGLKGRPGPTGIVLSDAVRQHPSDFLGKSASLPLVRLRLEAPASKAEIVAYARGGEALAGADAFDSPKMSSFVESASDAAFLLGGGAYAISAMDALKGSLPIRFEAGTEGAHSFALATENFADKVLLEDALAGALHDFADGAYAFQSAAGEFDGRFTLHLASTVTSSESVDALAHAAFHDGQALRLVVAGAEPQAYSLTDLAGRVLARGIAQPGDNAIATGQLASGVYLLAVGQQAAIKLVVR